MSAASPAMRSKDNLRMFAPVQRRDYTALPRLFPFQFRKCCSRVAGVVIVEQLPARSLAGRRASGGGRDRLALRDHAADIGRQRLEITPFVAKRGRPFAHGTVTG